MAKPAGTSAAAHTQESKPEATDYIGSVLLSPWLWGPLLTVGFYSAIPLFPVQRPFLERYFTAHWILYATTFLFSLGMAILGRKALRLLSERSVLTLNVAAPVDGVAAGEDVTRSERLLSALGGLSHSAQKTVYARRIREACNYVIGRQRSSGLEEHLKYLADIAVESLQGSYALVRTITWAIPILGFLGTVIGITMAIANVTPEQLNTSLGDVTAGLAVAFDTTALSLALSMILVFSTFLVERGESEIIGQVESLAVSRLAPLFAAPVEAKSESRFVAAELQAAEQLMQGTEALVSRQTEQWRDALNELRERWSRLAEDQQGQLAVALQTGLQRALQDHTQQLSEMRQEFSGELRSVSEHLAGIAAQIQNTAAQHERTLVSHASEVWQRLQQSVSEAATAQRAESAVVLTGLRDSLVVWQEQLQTSAQALTAQSRVAVEQGATLLKIAEQSQALNKLEHSLEQNLEAIRSTASFEETIHSLNAAVHLMTARARHAA